MPIDEKMHALAQKLGAELQSRMAGRLVDMEADDNSHYLIYRVLGVNLQEGRLIDEYQNKGRFLYRYAGSFLETAAKLCFLERYPNSRSARIPNTIGSRPKTFEIDCLVNRDAVEIKWRDATTDGDHITKEHTRLQNIANAHYKPIRVMFYYPNRTQAISVYNRHWKRYIAGFPENTITAPMRGPSFSLTPGSIWRVYLPESHRRIFPHEPR